MVKNLIRFQESEDAFDQEVITKIRSRNAEGDTTANRYRNIDDIESVLKSVEGRLRRFFRVPLYIFSGCDAGSGTYRKLAEQFFITIDGRLAICPYAPSRKLPKK
jgi:hypothetical protein